MSKLWCILVYLSILMFGLVSAAPPFQSNSFTSTGILIEHPYEPYLKIGSDHTFHFHIYNQTTGQPFSNLTSIICAFHLYNSTGDHLFINNNVPRFGVFDYEQTLVGNNFSNSGTYTFVFQCNNSINGGAYENDFYVNAQGKEYNTTDGLIYSVSFILLVLLFAGLLISAIMIPYDNSTNTSGEIIRVNYKKYVKISSGVFAYLVFVAIMFFAWNISYGILEYTSMSKFFFVFYKIAFVMIIPIFIISFVFSIIKFMRDKTLEKMLQRGLTVR